MTWTPYRGEDYLDSDAVEAWCQAAAAAFPDVLTLESIGTTQHGRPILMLTVAAGPGDPAARPGFWLDGGTHCAEWTGVMATLHTLTTWLEGLRDGDAALTTWFTDNVAYVVPCVSPDGHQAMHDGAPFIRSTLREPRQEQLRVGLEPGDVDGDGAVRWMRWRHPAGPWVHDPEHPLAMRPRSVDDDPADAWFFCQEGRFIRWDGVRWTQAPRRFGLDLNRNFPSHWAPFEMFGMDSGRYPGSAPESAAIMRAVADRPRIAAAVTNHTYTGCVLTQPYRKDGALADGDLDLMARLADLAVEGTGYKVYKVHPEFTYDETKPVVGVWSDALTETYGVPAWTLELWDPYGFAGVEVAEPAKFFRQPDHDVLRTVIDAFVADDQDVRPWTPFDHPQLGPVELGGIDYMRTIRNPPVRLLAEECARGTTVAERVRKALPRVQVHATVSGPPDARVLQVVVENLGFLPTSSLAHAEAKGMAVRVCVELDAGEGVAVVEGQPVRDLGHLDGWGSAQVGAGRHPIYGALPARGHRAVARWVLAGAGTVQVRWNAGRGGAGELGVVLGGPPSP